MNIEVESVFNYIPEMEIEETGKTYEENAIIKVLSVSHLVDYPVIADDSGLSIDALNGEPGVYSARYGGEDTPYEEKIKMILDRMKNVPDSRRTATYICVIALAYRDRIIKLFRGECEGYIAREPKYGNGFAYDSIFILPNGKYMSELTPVQKNRISHRFKALNKLKEFLQSHKLPSLYK